MGMLRQTEACILTLFWRFVQPFFAFVPLLVDSLRLLAWDSSLIPSPLAPIVTGRAFIDKLQSNIHSLKFQLLSSCS